MHYLYFVLLVLSINLFAKDAHMTSDEVLKTLIEGNQRYVEDRLLHPNRTNERRQAVTHTQKPFAIIVGCSDSRVSPEILFDLGVGDLFIVRVAGNVVAKIEQESIDYAASVLGSSVILVLGHENCGAVTAVVNQQTKIIPEISKLIKPAVQLAKKEKGNLLENSIKENVKQIVDQLKKISMLSTLVQKGKIKIIGGYYHLSSGSVEIL